MRNQTTVMSAAAQRPTADSGTLTEYRAQASLFKLVGRVIEQEIDNNLLQLLRTDLKEPLAQVGIHVDRAFFEDPESVVLENLEEEYTGLFVAPGGISPYLSVFETGALYREPCDQVYTAYQKAGWNYQRRYSGEFPDHIGTMLAFVGVLYEMQVEALEAGELKTSEEYAKQSSQFMLEFLGPWAPGWCRRASESAFLPFYQQMLGLTEQLLWSELAVLADRRKYRELAEQNRRMPKKLDYNADFRKASGI